MREDIVRKILKKLYYSYKRDREVLKFAAAGIFRDFGIANGADISSVYKSNFITMDKGENFYITNEGIDYMDKVFNSYEKLAGLIKDGEMVNRDKEIRAFAVVDKEIQNKQSIERPVFNISDSQLHFGQGSNIRKDGSLHSRKWQIVGIIIVPILTAVISWPLWSEVIFRKGTNPSTDGEERVIHLQNARKEISEDIRLIEWIQNISEELLTTNHTVLTRFHFDSLEEIATFHEDRETRELVLVTVYDLAQVNRLLDDMQDIQVSNQEDYFKVKSDKVQKLLELSREIRKKFSFLQENLK